MAYVIKNWNDGNRVYAVDINRWEKGIDDAHKEKLDKTAYTASDVLSKIVTVGGHNSGIDADKLDGQHGSYYAVKTTVETSLSNKLDKSSYTASDVLAKIKTVHGTGSGLDADLLDGKHASDFATSGHSHAWTAITDKPASATRWPAWSEVTDKPATATRWPSWGEVTGKPSTFTPSAHNQSWSTITDKPATATRWPSWSEVTSKPTLISYGTSVPSTLAYNTIFVKV